MGKGIFDEFEENTRAVYLEFVTTSDYGQRSTQRNGQRKHLKIKGFRVVIV